MGDAGASSAAQRVETWLTMYATLLAAPLQRSSNLIHLVNRVSKQQGCLFRQAISGCLGDVCPEAYDRLGS